MAKRNSGSSRSRSSNRLVVREAFNVPNPCDFYSSACEEYRVGGGTWAVALCPFHNDRHPSFAINLESGGYFCRSAHCGARGGSIVSFVMAREGLSYREALAWLEDYA